MPSKLFVLLGLAVFQDFVAANYVQVRDSKHQITYRGTTHDSVEHFQNVKFAHDTSGERRFSPPEPYTPPKGTQINATSPGPACPQLKEAIPPFFADTEIISEDCLNLRIARPVGTSPESNLPVVVWLHGGGVVKGSAYDPHFEPDKLIALSQSIKKPIIYVAINYRLTAFGFSRLPILEERKSLNVGMRDQRVGMQWVKDNIRTFGGDPTRITAFGLSAGGTFSSLHLMAYGGVQGVPFTQAWMMSGPPGTGLNMSSDVSTSHTLAVAEKVGCSQSGEEQLRCLRAVPMKELLETAMEHSVANHPPAGLFTFIPSVDGDIFPDRQSVLYKSGRFVRETPLVFGWTQDDGAMNAGPAQAIQKESDMIPVIRGFAHALSDADFTRLFSLYDAASFADDVDNYEATKEYQEPSISVHYFRLSRILRDLLFTCSSIDFGFEMHRQSSWTNAQHSGVYMYALNQSMLTPLWKSAGMPYIKVSHGSDTNYIFNGLFSEGQVSGDDLALSQEFATAFINFATFGNPNEASPEGSQNWPEAYPASETDRQASAPSSLNLQVVGGPYGTGPNRLHVARSTAGEDGQQMSDFAQEDTDEQQVLPGIRVGAMSSPLARLRKAILDREQLLQRCAFVNSLAEKLGV